MTELAMARRQTRAQSPTPLALYDERAPKHQGPSEAPADPQLHLPHVADRRDLPERRRRRRAGADRIVHVDRIHAVEQVEYFDHRLEPLPAAETNRPRQPQIEGGRAAILGDVREAREPRRVAADTFR